MRRYGSYGRYRHYGHYHFDISIGARSLNLQGVQLDTDSGSKVVVFRKKNSTR